MDCAVIGAGPAGVLASAALTEGDVEHVVLERGGVGHSWAHQRWDSFRLNTPAWSTPLFAGTPIEPYPTAPALVERLSHLAAGAVREGVEVRRLTPTGDGFDLDTSDGPLHARTVLVATGDENVPRLPPHARHVPARVLNAHVADYRAPGDLPAGRVLVVGSGQSGCQVADDLRAAGREVVLSTSPVGHVPVGYRGQDVFALLVKAGFFEQTVEQLPDPAMARAPQPIIAPDARPLSLRLLHESGVTLAGRVTGVDGARVRLDASVRAHIAAGDAFAAQVRGMVDGFLARAGADAPPADPAPPDDVPGLDPPESLDLADLAAVLWATGFTGDFGWLDPGLLDADGRPAHDSVAGPVPGLAYTGLRWLTRRGSSTLMGMPADAAAAAALVRRALDRPGAAG